MQAAARRMSAMRSAVTNDLERHTVPPRDEGGDLFGTLGVGRDVISEYTLWLFNIAMENGPFIDGLPIKNGDFPWLC
jgi:hypothetical protein